MKPTNFPEANIKFAEDQPEYETLPAFKDPGPRGEVITCWKLSLKERLQLLFFGRIWLVLLSFHQPLTPSYMSVKKSDVLETRKTENPQPTTENN